MVKVVANSEKRWVLFMACPNPDLPSSSMDLHSANIYCLCHNLQDNDPDFLRESIHDPAPLCCHDDGRRTYSMTKETFDFAVRSAPPADSITD
jgi:hypothetical protein